MSDFTHLDINNRPTMVDVSDKEITTRFAHARSAIILPPKVRELFKDGDINSKKGPVFATAIIAGTMGLKKTSELIPFCHQLNIESSKIEINMIDDRAVIDCKVKISGKTGVEMEALMGVQIAALTIYDMCKAFGHEMKIVDGQLIEKSGGKSGHFKR